MKKSTRNSRGFVRLWTSKPILSASLAGLAGLTLMVGASLGQTQTIPSNALNTADVPPPMFNSWFISGFPTLNGPVHEADSLNFPNVPNVDFYRWSWNMFLWLLSPPPRGYGGGGFVFQSPVFFDVSPPDPSGIRHFTAESGKVSPRTLTKHVPGVPSNFGVRVAALGPHNLPVIVTTDGKMFEIAPTRQSSRGRAIIADSTGKQIEISKIAFDSKKNPVFLDLKGKPIANPEASFDSRNPIKTGVGVADPEHLVQRFVVEKEQIFLGPHGRMGDVEVNQAANGVLMSQKGSLVYYGSMVNDVYAYFLTGTKNGGIPPTPANSVVVGPNTIFRFPTDIVGLNEVIAFGAANGVSFPDPLALCVELKTSWVDAATVPNPKDFVQTIGIVPVYDMTDPDHWKQIGVTKMMLAMVGMHVVGSTKGHPEMIWATFEHFGNAPNTKYQYIDNLFNTVVGPFDPGPWMFCSSPGGPVFNAQHMFYDPPTGDINSIFPFHIDPSDTNRTHPWGMPGANAPSNTQIISIDHSVLTQLIPGDIRGNYFMTGSTWTIGGAPPNGFNQVGTNILSNTTMETYQQSLNCFTCHQSTVGSPVATTDTSHIFGPLKPLF